jgi:hypothetical protein
LLLSFIEIDRYVPVHLFLISRAEQERTPALSLPA